MGTVTSLTKATAAGQHAARRRPDQRESARPSSNTSEMPTDGPVSLAAVLGSIMLGIEADRMRIHRSGR